MNRPPLNIAHASAGRSSAAASPIKRLLSASGRGPEPRRWTRAASFVVFASVSLGVLPTAHWALADDEPVADPATDPGLEPLGEPLPLVELAQADAPDKARPGKGDPRSPAQKDPSELTPEQKNALDSLPPEERGRVEKERQRLQKKAEEARETKFAQPAATPSRPPAGQTQPAQPQPAARPAASATAPAATGAAGAAPGAGTDAAPPQPLTPGGLDGDMFTFSAFGEPVELTFLVDFVQQEFGLQILRTDSNLKGQTVVLSTPITLHKDDVMRFLVMLLEQREYTMVQDRSGVYIVQPRNQVQAGIGKGELFPTRIIPTPGIRPSSLQQIVQAQVTASKGSGGGGGGGGGGQPAQPAGGATPSAISFLDDLGVIVINDSPRVTRIVEDLVKTIVAERREVKYFRLPVNNIAASSAKDRILELLGVASRGGFAGAAQPAPQGQPAAAVAGVGGTLSHLSDRLIVDSASNSLIFRGREGEKDQVTEFLSLVDVISTLVTKWYPVGNATSEAVASEGRRLQLGESSSFTAGDGLGGTGSPRTGIAQPQGGAPGLFGAQDIAGSGFILYPDSGGFVYRGTPEQHNRVSWLIDQLKDLSRSEEIVYEFYKLKHGKSEEISTVLQDLISSTSSAGSSPLLGRNLGSSSSRRNQSSRTADRNRQNNQPNQPNQPNAAGAGGENTVGELSSEDVFVIADEPNNQIVVRAPLKLQPQIKRLIDKLDLRRPQVYIEAMIVSVSDSENFRLAVEAQQIIGQFGLNTNFGLGSLTQTSGGTTPTTTGGFTSRKNVATNLSGLTAALIRSKDVPFIVTALQNNTNAKILAVPQLLVDDNVEAEVFSEDQQPTTSSNQGTSTTTTSFAGFESAGPRLTVTPQISEGGYMKLDYEITISAFQGDPVSPGVPPAKQENTIRAESVTVPSDATIVVGGLTQDSSQDIVVKVPILGDIPLIGTLFKDQRKNDRKTTFFVFITPKIMRDPSFADLRLLTRGPMKMVDAKDNWPKPEAEAMEVIDPRWGRRDQLIRPEDGPSGVQSPGSGGAPMAEPEAMSEPELITDPAKPEEPATSSAPIDLPENPGPSSTEPGSTEPASTEPGVKIEEPAPATAPAPASPAPAGSPSSKGKADPNAPVQQAAGKVVRRPGVGVVRKKEQQRAAR